MLRDECKNGNECSDPGSQFCLCAKLTATPSYSPGPWVDAGAFGAGRYIVSGSGSIAVAYGSAQNTASEANVRLIVAAPRLLQALCRARDFIASNLEGVIRDCSILDEAGRPDRASIDEESLAAIQEDEALLVELDAAIVAAVGP